MTAPTSETAAIANAVRFEEYEQILAACETSREHLLIRLLWVTGGRITEVLELRPDSIRADDTLQLLNEKQHKVKPGAFRPKEYKTLYIPADVVAELRAYIAAQGLPQFGYIFSAESPGEPLSRFAAFRLVGKIARRAGIFREKNTEQRGTRILPCNPHLFRHGCAVEMMEQGFTLGSIQRHLGHKNVQTTGLYAMVSDRVRRKETVKLRA